MAGTEGNGDDGSTDHPLAKKRTQDPSKKKRPMMMKSLTMVAKNRKNGGGDGSADLPGGGDSSIHHCLQDLASAVARGFQWSRREEKPD